MVYLSLSIPCLKKSKVTKKGLVVKPMVFSDMNSRAQVDLIDMQSQTGREKQMDSCISRSSYKIVEFQ